MNSIGWKPYAMRGIPKPRQLAPRQSNEPPCSCDLRLASRIASYSGVSGACWPLPHGLAGSKEGCPPKVPTRSTPLHCPFQSGYLISSPAATAPTAIASATASGATFSAKAPIVLRQSIVILPCASAACLRLDLSRSRWLHPTYRPRASSPLCAKSGRDARGPLAASLSRLLEISQIRRRLVFLGGHQQAVAGKEVVFLAEHHMIVGLVAIIVLPQFVAVTPICLGDRPRPRQRVVDRCDLIVQEVRIVLVQRNPLQDDRLVVGVQRQAAGLVRARALEVAGFHFERVVAAVAVGIEPFADRVTLIDWFLVFRKPATVGVDAARHECFEMDVGDGRHYHESDREGRGHDPRHAVGDT